VQWITSVREDTGYTAVPEDYDGDGMNDFAVNDDSNGDWFIKYSGGEIVKLPAHSAGTFRSTILS
jgi:hypothetical protein